MSLEITEWPKVTPDDDGIRPAGGANECAYCQQKIGSEHKKDCVIIDKIVKLKYTFEITVLRPHCWDKHDIEFQLNDGSSCVTNWLNELISFDEELQKMGDCLCNRFKGEFLEVVDSRPRTKTVKPKG